MDTAIISVPRRPELVSEPLPLKADGARKLTVEALYTLSENGRKASLLNGGNGRAVQELTLPVPANRLHLVTVDAEGVARLKLQPRYQLDGERGVVRFHGAPSYDARPDVDALSREAARNHQLEKTYDGERRAAKA